MVFSSQARNVMFCKAYVKRSPMGEVRAIAVRVSYDEGGKHILTDMQVSVDISSQRFMHLVKSHQELNNVRRLDISMTKQVAKMLERNDNRLAA
jgi:hypothetical protein